MAEADQLATTAPAVSLTTSPAEPPAIREVEKGAFVETFTVKDHGKKYEVAANALSNRAMMQINVAKLRSLCEKTVKLYDDAGIAPSPKELKAIVDAVSMVEDMSIVAYGDPKKGERMGNALERLAYGLVRGAVDGAKAPGSHSPEARLNRLKQIGKRHETQVIDIPESK